MRKEHAPKVTRKKDDIDFEIEFYENILKETPDFIEALSAIGDLYTRAGMWQKGLDVDIKLSQLRPEDAIVFYNLACSYALLNQIIKNNRILGPQMRLFFIIWLVRTRS